MHSKAQHVGRIALVLALAVVPMSGQAIAPVLLVLIKQIAQQAATSMMNDLLLSSLSGMGCKGIALSNALTAFDLRGGGAAGLLGGMPQLPAGLSMPTIPTIPTMPTLPGGIGAGMVIGGPAAAVGGEQTALLARAKELISLPPGFAMDPAQMAMMARAQQAMSQPLSPPETLATIDELFELGFLPRSIQTELKECMVLVPAAIPALGMGMGLLRPMLPQLRQAREELRALSPAEQDEVAALLATEVKALPADQRAALLEHIDSGFFPPQISAGVRARVAAQ